MRRTERNTHVFVAAVLALAVGCSGGRSATVEITATASDAAGSSAPDVAATAPGAPPADAGGGGSHDGTPETIGSEGGRTSAEQLAATQLRSDSVLSMENILGGSGGPIVAEFSGESGAVAGVHTVLADGGGYTTTAGTLLESDPGVDAGSPGRGRVRTSGVAPAGGSGHMSADVFRTTLGRKRGAIETCYNDALADDGALAGDVTLLVGISTEGAVTVEVEQGAPSLQAAGVTDCVVARLRSMDFSSSPPQGGDFRIRLPMSFLPPEE